MLLNRVWPRLARNLCTSSARYWTLETLQDASIDTFRQKCFVPERPALLPRSHFRDLPAVKHWFDSTNRLNVEYLQTHAADAFVPLELTELAAESLRGETTTGTQVATVLNFRQFHAPLTLFLDWMCMAETSPQSTRLYLAQCQLLDLPLALRQDFPTPELVAQAGKGDVYDTNVWIGHPPTYTPLHRDPNPNLFVQLAGHKVVRLLPPADGQALFASVRRQLNQSGDREAAAFRGEEMMQGQERALLDKMVWDVPVSAGSETGTGFEAHVGAGDGLFIPKGWWHGIKGIGEGVTASVNWWFRLLGLGGYPFRSTEFCSNTSKSPINHRRKSSMLVSRAYRAALLHLSVNPILTRASAPSTGALAHLPQTPATRLSTILFPQCAISKSAEPIRIAHTMAGSNSALPSNSKPDTHESQPQESQQQQDDQHLYLPAKESNENDSQGQHRLEVDGSAAKLDHLGPMVVNVDGTLSRISNWEQMTEMERKTTLRVLGKRNKQRLEALKAAGGEGESK
ncbi:hypothetical protein NUU61_009719 [Penicillium alfredii]|uniref:JmjC domain-containing protein n=1 Tax=Penicillium alfredii TaxID=1506179 RepID=A0A9W9EGS0_9EURO|nr:uncharacterized protein NUU61_009719 [Penicillium alfredii]KAJ5081455.1 hypothetical protein NUU61_009719 [Penicillium alfredii]